MTACVIIFLCPHYLQVLNRDFEETCSVDSDLRSVLYMLFNPVKDELITGGVGGIKVCFVLLCLCYFQTLTEEYMKLLFNDN